MQSSDMLLKDTFGTASTDSAMVFIHLYHFMLVNVLSLVFMSCNTCCIVNKHKQDNCTVAEQ